MTASLARAATLRKFNPGAMQSDEEIIRQFVVRHHQFEIVIEVLKENLNSESNQHLLIVAPRGRGKTMLLARVAAELRREPELSERLLPVRFSEESQEILGIADFWLECLLHLANTLNDTDPDRAEALRDTHADLATIMDDKQLEQRARAAVLGVADELNRQLVLMIENLQDLTSDANEDFGWQLRKILQTEPRIMLVASATSRFEGLLEVDQAFFELFREVKLPPLDTKECQQLWQVTTGQSIETRGIKPLQILTGGSPRLLIFIASFSRHHSTRQLMEELVCLIDDHTEYFRGHLEALPPQERRVYISVLDLWQAATAQEVAQRARMDIRPTSSLLGRLMKRGAISVESKGKKKYYCATERLHSIYYKLRRERNEAAVVQGLIMFMAAFYTSSEFQDIAAILVKEPYETPMLMRGMQLAMRTDEISRERLLEYMTFDDCQHALGVDAANGEWAMKRMSQASDAYVHRDYILALKYLDEVIKRFGGSGELTHKEATAMSLINRSIVLIDLERKDEALECLNEVIESFDNNNELILKEAVARALVNRGGLLGRLGQTDVALESNAEVVARFGDTNEPTLKNQVANALLNIGMTLTVLERMDEAIESYAEIIDRFGESEELILIKQVATALLHRSSVLGRLERFGDSLDSSSEIVKRFCKHEELDIKELLAKALINSGLALAELDRKDKALESYAEVINRFGDVEELVFKEQVGRALVSSGVILSELERKDAALESYAEVAKRLGESEDLVLKKLLATALLNSGAVLGELKRTDEALDVFKGVIKRFGESEECFKEQTAKAIVNCGIALTELQRNDEALESLAKVVNRFSDESAIELQMEVARAVVMSVKLGDSQSITAGLYLDWYHRMPIDDAKIVRNFYHVTIQLHGAGVSVNRLIKTLETDAGKAKTLQPLIVALRQEAGEKVRAPAEVLEVAADVRREMNKIRSDAVDKGVIDD